MIGAIRCLTRNSPVIALGGLGNFFMKWNLQHACFKTADPGAVVRSACRPTGLSERSPHLAPRWSSAIRRTTRCMFYALEARAQSWDSIGQPLANARAMVQPLALLPADERADAALAGCDCRLVRPLHAPWSLWIRRTGCFWILPARRICSAVKPSCEAGRTADRTRKVLPCRAPLPARPGGKSFGALCAAAPLSPWAAKRRRSRRSHHCFGPRRQDLARPAPCRVENHRPWWRQRLNSELSERLGKRLSPA